MRSHLLSPGRLPSLLLSPKGAIDRPSFVAGISLLAATAWGLDRFVTSAEGTTGLISFLFVVAIAWSAGCLSRKRLHDIGRSGLLIAPFLGCYIVLAASSAVIGWLDDGARLIPFLVAATSAGPMLVWLMWLSATRGVSDRPVALAAMGDLPA